MRQRSTTTESGENARGTKQKQRVRKCVRARVSIVDVARTITIVTVSFASKTLVLCVLTHVCVDYTEEWHERRLGEK